ncbi:TetR/AcrR family transcriptional regulator [Nonomuraea guangzhouensis]|uniref:TetR/AcrR family transcriptional regulator n=1 Tax=Nonomuraea guangzhouensis TaxID=1291555 RepID=A0ABW4G1M9_9ACTN|nr:TetR family transcriptional regulator C-terminal domain-containing protein [Nonomuraea guangzhouensis]
MKRSEVVADAAITLLAERGMRGLTHRAVDEAADLPPGSTSNLARTRAALLELTLSRLTDLEEQALASVYRFQGPTAPTRSSDAFQGSTAPARPSEAFQGSTAPARPSEAFQGSTASARSSEAFQGSNAWGRSSDAFRESGSSGGAAGSLAESGPYDGAAEAILESDLPGLVAEALHVQLADRRRTLARYELALEATRRPELRKIYDAAGRRFRDPVVGFLAAVGSPDPVRHGRQLVAFGEGIMFDSIAGAGDAPSLDDLREAVREFLRGMLGAGV